jgi:hypothetical protein
MTHFQTALTTAAPRRAVVPITVRLKKSARAFKQRCAAWFAPSEVEEADYFYHFEAREW